MYNAFMYVWSDDVASRGPKETASSVMCHSQNKQQAFYPHQYYAKC